MLSEILKEIFEISEHNRNINTGMKGNPNMDAFKKEFNEIFVKNIEKNEYYETKVSEGVGGNRGNPWIGIRDSRITKDYNKDFLIMYSFASKDSIMLAFHTNELKKETLKILTCEINTICNDNIENGFYFTKDIPKPKDINRNKYFLIKAYSLDNLNEEILIHDLKYLVNIYQKLVPKYIEMFPKYEKLIPKYKEIFEKNREKFKEYDKPNTHDSFINNLMKKKQEK